MYIVRKSVLLMVLLMLTACSVASLGFGQLDYPVTAKKVIGKLVLIVPKPALQRQFTIPASELGATDNQVVLAGQMLANVADYEYPKIFSSYDRVFSMSDISPGFYRAMMRLFVANFTVEHHTVTVALHADMYSYQGKLLYQKSFMGSAKITSTLQVAALEAYRNAMQQVNDRLEQLLYWEDHATDANHDGV